MGDAGFEPATSAVQSQRSRYVASYRRVPEIRLSILRSALTGLCECCQISSLTASATATQLLIATFLASLILQWDRVDSPQNAQGID